MAGNERLSTITPVLHGKTWHGIPGENIVLYRGVQHGAKWCFTANNFLGVFFEYSGTPLL